MKTRKSPADVPHEIPGIGLFGTRAGIRAVGSPVRIRILSVLRDRELSFEEIVALSGKAKSTVSVHLKGLLAEGIIGEKPDPDDMRKKIFFIQSDFLGGTSPRAQLSEKERAISPDLFRTANDPFVFYRMMFRTIRVSLLAEGINIDPILEDAGVRVGQGMYGILADPDLDHFVRNTASFWQQHNLGRIEVENLNPVVLSVFDCFECGELPVIGRPSCAFDAGILSSLFSSHFSGKHQVRELRCYAMNDDHCRFQIEPLPSKSG
nr:V4R domain-containing protein [uncultured Methanoregula sp.]